MKQIIPFRKDIVLKTNIAEVTSISIEHDVKLDDKNNCFGEFIVSGTYKMTDVSINNEPFSYDIPFDIILDDDYIMSSVNVDINDFYYEIINDNILRVNIELSVVGKKNEKTPSPVFTEAKEDRNEIKGTDDCSLNVPITTLETDKSEFETLQSNDEVEDMEAVPLDYTDINEEIVDVVVPKKEIKTSKQTLPTKSDNNSNISIFDSLPDDDDNFSTYNVHIVQEGQTIENILEEYGCNLEELSKYNSLDDFGIGYKVIVPDCNEAN